MATENTNVSGTVQVKDNSPERVAFDLLKYIISASPERQDEVLELYARCVLTTREPGRGLDSIKEAVKG